MLSSFEALRPFINAGIVCTSVRYAPLSKVGVVHEGIVHGGFRPSLKACGWGLSLVPGLAGMGGGVLSYFPVCYRFCNIC